MRPIKGLIPKQVSLRLMARYSKICVCITGIILSLLALLPSFKQTPVTSPQRPPRRFFPAGSAVIDFPYGNMNPIVDLLHSEEILFVMYYAPWCSQSVAVREEFQKAAKYMLDKMKFVGVNCWYPEGACRNTYKFLKFPELYIYHTNLDGFRFNGLPTADELVRFAEDILYPMTFLHTVESINNFSAMHDNIMIGNFDMSTPTPPGLQSYYIAAMRMIELDHLQPVRFSIVNKPYLLELLGLNDTKQLILLNLNGSFIYPLNYNFTSQNIIRWTNKHRYQNLVKWISVTGHKSLQLSTQLDKGPTLVVFAPVNRLHAVDFYYVVLRELVLRYRNCHNKTIILLLETLLKRRRHQTLSSVVLPSDCRTPVSNSTLCCVSLFQNQRICELCKRQFDSRIKDSCQFSPSESIPASGFGNIAASCLESYQHYNANEYRTLTCKQCVSHASQTCGLRHSSDPYVNKLVNEFTRTKCKRLSFQKSLLLESEEKLYNPEMDQEPVPTEFTGFKCRYNKTVSVVILDKNKHQAFLDRLGTFVPKEKNSSVSVIIDKKNEVQYLLRQPFSKSNIANFVMNFSRGDLDRHLRSEVVSNRDVCDSDVCVLDATSSTFQSIAMDKEKDVLLLVYTPWCGFCSKFSHIFLSVAGYFRASRDVVFARINAKDNDLPWQYTIDRYPTLLFFPAHRKADSVKFPETVPLTLPNLIKFILYHATNDLRMDTAVDVCTKRCIERNLRKVSQAIVSNIKRRQLLEGHLMKLKAQYEARPTSVRFKSAVQLIKQRLKKLDRQYQNAFILLNFLKSSQTVLDKDKLKDLIDNQPSLPKPHSHDEL